MSRDLSSPIAYVIGEALIDAVTHPGAPAVEHPGGSPANVALTLGRLGRRAQLLTHLGRDHRGDTVAAWLEQSQVSVDDASRGALRTSVAHALLDDTGAASYEFDLTWDLPDGHVVPGDAVVVHTGSIAATVQPGGAKVHALLASARDHATLTYDPNMRPTLMGSPDAVREIVEGYVSLCDVVKVSDEDLAWLYPGQEPHDVARRWAGQGPAFVVVTEGGAGALLVTHDGRTLTVSAPRVDVVDTVGAGDSFMGALIHGLWQHGVLGGEHREELRALSDDALTQIISQCAAVAAITVSRAGANPPWLGELPR
ncbi:carbohydrate kinase family protein [Jonesia denitrificans]|uniref:PfkB domain protein n=1 Tax=Jonesia denitrificans (strain ATCC 14870 / DSM 20603 / BCRC 15368 / CIP 55.134 / JCM 11481 / NBRC 15587 / NCTC 10816 / Prevot 55134) TaxID=471856 RepID=C7R1T9_JONDD|nr:carbohydrate kinase [Jonesia denitrificans]ACV08407.1 PfkB domain protein [Jonesia denitrificans DSM 20603]ASE07944.1 carbohydrate kinase [Jonesia denitrificans]QXB42552.1 carbohydrate kinase [Jonesia denitrificans]SQH20386.1 5-dehydro-2-deoxygluconokinase [Jonesia denitrificans]